MDIFEKEIEEYERLRILYKSRVTDKMSHKAWTEYNEILFSAHSCAIEGNSFTVDDTRTLYEKGSAKNIGDKLIYEYPLAELI